MQILKTTLQLENEATAQAKLIKFNSSIPEKIHFKIVANFY